MPRDIFTPLPESNTKRLRTTLELPFGMTEKVGIHTNHIERLMQFGGIRTLRIENSKSNERSKHVPQIVGVNSSGSALAGKSIVEHVPTHEWIAKDDDDVRYKGGRWIDVDAKINTGEMGDRIRSRDASLREAEEWANELNSALANIIVRAGVSHLLGDFWLSDQLFTSIIYGFDVFLPTLKYIETMGSGTTSSHSLSETIITNIILGGIIFTFLESAHVGLESPGRGRRMSLFYGFEIDRALFLAIGSRIVPMVGVVEE